MILPRSSINMHGLLYSTLAGGPRWGLPAYLLTEVDGGAGKARELGQRHRQLQRRAVLHELASKVSQELVLRISIHVERRARPSDGPGNGSCRYGRHADCCWVNYVVLAEPLCAVCACQLPCWPAIAMRMSAGTILPVRKGTCSLITTRVWDPGRVVPALPLAYSRRVCFSRFNGQAHQGRERLSILAHGML